MEKKFNIELPSAEEMEMNNKRHFDNIPMNLNNFSYWFPKIMDCGFDIPETIVLPITYEQYKWLQSDNYTPYQVGRFSKYIIDYLKANNDFRTDRTLFLKTGQFSGKFDFNRNCKLTDIKNIGKQFLNIFYTGMCMDCPDSNELVIREYIESRRKKIYNGMPLNTEFRVFYDFDKKEIMGIFNYWHRKVMSENLTGEDKETFLSEIDNIEKEYKEHSQSIFDAVMEKMRNVDLSGQWSIDIMLVNGKKYLIDMALAQNSYYYDLLKKN